MQRFFKSTLILKVIVVLITVFVVFVLIVSRPPRNFPSEEFYFHIEKGTSLSKISKGLYTKNIISSELAFKAFSFILSKGKGLKAGDYKFSDSTALYNVAQRMSVGDQRLERVRVTIYEGANSQEMSLILLKKMPSFDVVKFVGLAKKHEGFLFPDTYDFFSNVKPEFVIESMRENFSKKIKPIEKEILQSKRTLKDVVIMASILEEEANNEKDRRIISGILWKRMREGMPLQVDAPFQYITGRKNVTSTDLKIDSPYNTYIYKGLPVGPISSPSIEAIQDAVDPVYTKYYFYLTGKDGLMHYAVDFDGHVKNKNIYLR